MVYLERGGSEIHLESLPPGGDQGIHGAAETRHPLTTWKERSRRLRWDCCARSRIVRKCARNVTALLAVAGSVSALGQSYELLYQTDQFVGAGSITSPFRNGQQGFRNAAVNNNGKAWVHVGLTGFFFDFDEA